LLSAKQIAPGQSGQIEVTVKTEGISAGPLGKTVTVRSNDPRQPQIVLNVNAVITLEFTLSVRQVYFGQVPKGKEAVQEFLVNIAPERPVKILSAESTDGSVTVRIEPVSGSNGKTVKVVAVQKSDAKDGYHFGHLILKTSSPLTPELRVAVRGMVVASQGN
jgi:hypothetical protein